VHRHAEEEVVRHLRSVVQHRRAALRIEGAHQGLRVPRDVALAKCNQSASDAAGDGGIGTGNGITSEICDRSPQPAMVRKSCINSAVSLGAVGT
jgi:hypothetical protein